MDIQSIVVTVVLSLIGGFILLLIHPEISKLVQVIRKNPYNTFIFIGMCIVIAGVVKVAFLQG
ncbi:hypothetical protein ACFQ1X_14150 [Metaplanococcus flavidus]|uniref:DUF3953 domain-containing protein n=1 Tax=Metaplanococcus flavidus TaxID=569883 RepID=A0ABW3LF62_9BACL